MNPVGVTDSATLAFIFDAIAGLVAKMCVRNQSGYAAA